MNISIGGCALPLAFAALGLTACSTPDTTASATSAGVNASAVAPTQNPANVVSGADGVSAADASAGAPATPAAP